MNKNWKIVALTNGFYFFGNEVTAPDGFIKIVEASMFGGFGGGKGMPGLARGDKSSTVTLDKFTENGDIVAPLTSVVFISDSINLYEFKGTTLR